MFIDLHTTLHLPFHRFLLSYLLERGRFYLSTFLIIEAHLFSFVSGARSAAFLFFREANQKFFQQINFAVRITRSIIRITRSIIRITRSIMPHPNMHHTDF